MHKTPHRLRPAFPFVRTKNKHALFNKRRAAGRTYQRLLNLLSPAVLLSQAHYFRNNVVGTAHPYPAAQFNLFALYIPFIIERSPFNRRSSYFNRVKMRQRSNFSSTPYLPAHAFESGHNLLGKKFICNSPPRKFIRIAQKLSRPEIGKLYNSSVYLKIQALPASFYILKLINYIIHIGISLKIWIYRKPLLL